MPWNAADIIQSIHVKSIRCDFLNDSPPMLLPRFRDPSPQHAAPFLSFGNTMLLCSAYVVTIRPPRGDTCKVSGNVLSRSFSSWMQLLCILLQDGVTNRNYLGEMRPAGRPSEHCLSRASLRERQCSVYLRALPCSPCEKIFEFISANKST